MANSRAGQVTWEFDVDNSQFISGLNESERQVQSFAKSTDKSLSTSFNSLNKSMVDVAKSIGGISFKTLETSAQLATTVLVALGTKGIATGNYMQSLQLQMNGLTKSVESGAKAMAIASDYWQNNPFQRVDVAATTKTLLAMGRGVGDLAGDLKLLGNISVTTGVPLQSIGTIFGQVAASGRVMGGEILQLTQNGIAILPALQKQLGLTADEVRDMASEGKISFADFRKAMESIVDPSIIDQMLNTLPRQYDRLNGALTALSLAFVGSTQDVEKGYVASANGLLQSVTTLTKNVADSLKLAGIAEAATAAGNVFAPLVDKISSFFKTVGEGASATSPAATIIIGFFKFIESLGPVLIPILGLLAISFSGLFAQIPIVGELIGGIAGQIRNFTSALGDLSKNGADLFIGSFGKAISNIPESFNTALSGMQRFKSGIESLSAPVSNFTKDFVKDFKLAQLGISEFTNASGSMGEFFQKKTPSLQAFGGKVLEIGSTVGDFFGSKTQTIQTWGSNISSQFEKVKGPLSTFGGFATKTLGGAFDVVGGGISKIGNIAGQVASSLTGPLLAGIGTVAIAAATMGDDFGNKVTEMTNKVITEGPKMAANFTKNIASLGDSISAALPQLLAAFSTIFQTIANFIITNGPTLIQQFTNIVIKIIQEFTTPANLSLFATAVVTLFTSIAGSILQMLPVVFEAMIKIVIALINAFSDPKVVTDLITQIVAFVIKMTDILVTNLPTIINGMVTLLTTLISVITRPDILQQLINATIQIILAIVKALLDNLPMLVRAGVQLVIALVNGLLSPETISRAAGAMKQIGYSIIGAVGGIIGQMPELGSQLVRGLFNGIGNMTSWIVDKVKGFGGSVVNSFKSVFGIKSPSRVMRDQVGNMIGAGLGEGIIRSSKIAVNAAKISSQNVIDEFSSRTLASQSISSNFSANMSPANLSGDQYDSNAQSSASQVIINQNNTVNTELDMNQINRNLAWELNSK